MKALVYFERHENLVFTSEYYETGSGDVRKRTAQLRKLGFEVSVQACGLYRYGKYRPDSKMVKLTMLTITGDLKKIPMGNIKRAERNVDYTLK